jgi:hypothetical protein
MKRSWLYLLAAGLFLAACEPAPETAPPAEQPPPAAEPVPPAVTPDTPRPMYPDSPQVQRNQPPGAPGAQPR